MKLILIFPLSLSFSYHKHTHHIYIHTHTFLDIIFARPQGFKNINLFNANTNQFDQPMAIGNWEIYGRDYWYETRPAQVKKQNRTACVDDNDNDMYIDAYALRRSFIYCFPS